MKTLLRIEDFDIKTGETLTNKGIFSNHQFNVLLNKLYSLKIFYDYREVKRGWIFYDFDPVKFMNMFNS
jgi:hypothetical protein